MTRLNGRRRDGSRIIYGNGRLNYTTGYGDYVGRGYTRPGGSRATCLYKLNSAYVRYP